MRIVYGVHRRSVVRADLELLVEKHVSPSLVRYFRPVEFHLLRKYAFGLVKRRVEHEDIFLRAIEHEFGDEVCLWQVPMFNRFISDFVFPRKSLVVELDGESHDDSSRDDLRDEFFKSCGFHVLRLMNQEWPSFRREFLKAWHSLPEKDASSWLPYRTEPKPKKKKERKLRAKPEIKVKPKRIKASRPPKRERQREIITELLKSFQGQVTKLKPVPQETYA